MIRTSPDLVKAILLNDYNGTSDLDSFIQSASVIVDRLLAYAKRQAAEIVEGSTGTIIVPEDDDLELIERWLAAHTYCQSDKTLASKNTGGAGGSFSGQTGKGFDSTLYGQMAKRLDQTGYLNYLDAVATGTASTASVSGRPRAGGFWTGR